jgi:hypothetical protein
MYSSWGAGSQLPLWGGLQSPSGAGLQPLARKPPTRHSETVPDAPAEMIEGPWGNNDPRTTPHDPCRSSNSARAMPGCQRQSGRSSTPAARCNHSELDPILAVHHHGIHDRDHRAMMISSARNDDFQDSESAPSGAERYRRHNPNSEFFIEPGCTAGKQTTSRPLRRSLPGALRSAACAGGGLARVRDFARITCGATTRYRLWTDYLPRKSWRDHTVVLRFW